MQYKLVKFYSKHFVDLSKMRLKNLNFIFFAIAWGAAFGFTTEVRGALTISPVNGTLPEPSPTPYTRGQLNFYYYVLGLPSSRPSPTPGFLDPRIQALDVTRGAGYNIDGTSNNPANPWVDDTSVLQNAFGVNISSNSNLQINANTVVMIQVQTTGGFRYVPIAGMGGVNGSSPVACSAYNCTARNLNNSISPPSGSSANLPFYAGIVRGNSFSVYFYPKDICQDGLSSSIGGCTANSVSDPGLGQTSMSLNFLIQNLPNPMPSPLPTITPLDSTPNPINFLFQTGVSTFICPNLNAVTIKPDDGRFYIDASQFSLTSNSTLAPAQNFVVVARENGTPSLASNFDQPGVNNVISNQYGSAGNSLFFASGFTNSTTTTRHPYYLGFMIQDHAGIYTPPSIQASPSPSPAPTPAFPPTAANLSCTLFGPMETAAVFGALGSDTRCFIASAAFQSRDAGPVQMLREFRDRVLLRSLLGVALVEWYYEWSPQASLWLHEYPVFRLPVLLGLFKLQVIAWICLHPGLFLFMFLIGLGFGLGWLKLNRRTLHAS